MFASIFGYGPGSRSETLELRIRIRQRLRILADPDQQTTLVIRLFMLENRGLHSDMETHTAFLLLK
jgi:hypothetical protein